MRYSDLDDRTKTRFLELARELRPESLSCDGELSSAVVRRKAALLRREWHALEERIGFSVSEDDVFERESIDVEV